MRFRSLLDPIYTLRRLNYKIYELRHPDEPWIAQGAIRFCSEHLSKKQIGLEWGSGRSTLWFAERLQSLTSVEHDEIWYQKISAKISERGIRNITYLFEPLHHPVSVAIPLSERLSTSYVRVVDRFAVETLDLVVVDGHYREACVMATLPKLRIGGFLLLDNSDWLALSEWGVPPTWKMVHQSRNVMTQTTVWQKPSDAHSRTGDTS